MRIVSSCQGNSLQIFLRLLSLLETRREVSKAGVYVSDSMAFDKVSDPRLKDNSISLMTEWDVFTEARGKTPDWDKIRAFEKKIGDPVFWNILLADRRVFFGRRCKMTQDYIPRFSYEEMGSILEVLLDKVDQFFKELKPDLVISFGTSNVGDYLFYLFARYHNIPFLQLKATKISNRVSLNDDIIELSSHIFKAYKDVKPFGKDILQEAQQYIKDVDATGVQYEGAILSKNKIDFVNIVVSLLKGAYADFRKYKNPLYRLDNHLEPYFLIQLHEKIINPIKFSYQKYYLRNSILTYKQLDELGKFAFFPLHFEPEVSMQVVGRPYQNQIELIRNLALNLPAGMRVVVKEHPRSKGFRSLNYYKKLLAIPNVVMVNAELSTNLVSKKSALVAVISGSTGLEAAIIGRPVITFGKPVYNVLPDSMVKHIENMNVLAYEIKELLEIYSRDISALERYIASTIAGSAPIDLYSVLLNKPNRFNAGGNLKKVDREVQQYNLLANYLDVRINEAIAINSK